MKYHFRRTTLIIVSLIFMLGGLYAAKFVVKAEMHWLIVLVPLLLFSKKFRLLQIVLIVVVSFAFGYWRGSQMIRSVELYLPLYGAEVQLFGRVSDDQSFNEQRNQTEFYLKDASIKNIKLPGRVLVASQVNYK